MSSETSGDSPIRHLEFHTPFLRPAPFARSQTPSDIGSLPLPVVSAAVLVNRARRPAEGLTEDWIRQHTGLESSGEKYNWLSDDPGDSEHSSLSGSISGEASDWLDQDADPRTPTLKNFLGRRGTSRSGYRYRHHHRQTSTETLKQEDFSDLAQGDISIMSQTDDQGSSAAVAGTDADATVLPSIDEKPLPPPPAEPKEEPALSSAAPQETLQSSAPVPTPSPVPGPPRLKKKVPWKGNKNIVVLLPWDDERGQSGKAPAPMTAKAVAAMFKEWEQLGYNIKGFDLEDTTEGGVNAVGGQSRITWPTAEDILSEREKRQYPVGIPDRKEWDAYVAELQEAKLRALGVSFGEEPAPTISPAASMSRQTSMQYPPLPFSPPLPTSSAASSHMNLFSPVLVPGPGVSTSQSSNPGSIASPAPHQAQVHSKFNPRQSISISAPEHPFGSPFQYPQQPSPGVWSPQHMLYQQGTARGASPSVNNPAFVQDGYFQQGDALSQLQMRQQQLQNQHQLSLQTPTGISSPLLQEVQELEDEDLGQNEEGKSTSITPNATQNIGHDAGTSLQQEIEDAEYHLEEQFQRQLEHDDYSPHSDHAEDAKRVTDISTADKDANGIQNTSTNKGGLGSSRFAEESDEGPVLHHPQPHSRGHSLSQRPFQDSAESSSDAAAASEAKPLSLPGSKSIIGESFSDIETNPSNLGTPTKGLETTHDGHDRSMSIASNPWADGFDNTTRRPQHSKTTSISKLNVAAKEFVFDPSNTLNPAAFSFNPNNFQPFGVNDASFAPNPAPQPSFNHFPNHSLDGSRSKIDVEAPEFAPRRSEFSFSAIGPSFRPDAPAFTPSFNFSASVGSSSTGQPHTPIFSNIDLSSIGISKPAKKSKAIPIVRPDSSHSRHVEDDTLVDSDGRVTQGEGRVKRARGAKDDGDSVPVFAEPSMPLTETSREQSPPKEAKPGIVSPTDKENSAEFAPWEFKNQEQAEEFNAARPFTTFRYGSDSQAYEQFSGSDGQTGRNQLLSNTESNSKDEAPKKHKKNSLSATAKPFIFRPGALNFEPVKPESQKAVEPEPEPEPEPAPRRSTGLLSSRYAMSPPPQEPAQYSPPVLDSHEEASFQASLPREEPQSEIPLNDATEAANREPTFEEIDDIMTTLNAAEFESNAHRDTEPPAWYQPTPARNVQVPVVNHSSPIRLEPQNLMRSDAPSPSPRRFAALPGDTNPQRIFSRQHDDPFMETPGIPYKSESPVRRLNRGDSLPASEWDDVLSQTDELKLAPRSRFFDSHVNDLVGGLLAERLDPLEKTLATIQSSLEMMSARASSSRRDRRSTSAELAESDADDEDDDAEPRRSMSPRRERKLEKIRNIVVEALAAHQSELTSASQIPPVSQETTGILKALEEMKEQFGQSMRLDFRGEDLRNVVEEAVQRQMPSSPKPVIDEASIAREAEAAAAAAAAKIAELEDKLRIANSKAEEEIQNRRAAEDSVAEMQRRLRLSSEEEVRLREAIDERDIKIMHIMEERDVKIKQVAEEKDMKIKEIIEERELRIRGIIEEKDLKIKEIEEERDLKVRSVEDTRAKTMMRITMLEAVQDNAQKAQQDLSNKLGVSEQELREARKEIHQSRWKSRSNLRRPGDTLRKQNRPTKPISN